MKNDQSLSGYSNYDVFHSTFKFEKQGIVASLSAFTTDRLRNFKSSTMKQLPLPASAI